MQPEIVKKLNDTIVTPLNTLTVDKEYHFHKVTVEDSVIGCKQLVLWIEDFKVYLPKRYYERVDDQTIEEMNKGGIMIYKGEKEITGGKTKNIVEFK